MIRKITRGSDCRGLVRYLFGRGKTNEHEQARVIAASAGMSVPLAEVLDPVEDKAMIALIADQLEGNHLFFKERMKLPDGISDRHSWHLSLTNAATDRVLSDDEWAHIAGELADRMGFNGTAKTAPCQWITVRHGLSKNGNDHIHMAVDLIDDQGHAVNVWDDRNKVAVIAHEMEGRYNLTVVPIRGAPVPAMSKAELEIGDRRPAGPERQELARKMREAAELASTESEYVRLLRGSGVDVQPPLRWDGMSPPSGYRVAPIRYLPGGEQQVWRSGGKVAGKDLTLPALRDSWGQSADDALAAVAVWKEAGWQDRAPSDWTERGWANAAKRIHKSAADLRQTPAEDRLAYRKAAREASAAAAALARRAQSDRPDLVRALQDASHALARSAQVQPGERRPTRGGQGRDVVAVVARAVAHKDGWVALIVALAAIVQAVERAHRAQGEQLAASMLRRDAGHRLQMAEALLERSSGGLARPDRARPGPDRLGLDPSLLPPDLGRDDRDFGR